MSDDRPDLPEVLKGAHEESDVDSVDPVRDTGVRTGDGDVLVSRGDEPVEETQSGMVGSPPEDVEGVEQDPQKEMTAWFRAAEGLVLAYWHDPRTAIKYAVAILRLLQEEKTEKELLAIDPTEIPPITETQVGWQ